MDPFGQQQLAAELHRLSRLWEESRHLWTDSQSLHFERRHWEPLVAATRRFLAELADLEEASRRSWR